MGKHCLKASYEGKESLVTVITSRAGFAGGVQGASVVHRVHPRVAGPTNRGPDEAGVVALQTQTDHTATVRT